MAVCGNIQTAIEFIEFGIWAIPIEKDGSVSEEEASSNRPNTLQTSDVSTAVVPKSIEEFGLSKYKVSFIFASKRLVGSLRNIYGRNSLITMTLKGNKVTLINVRNTQDSCDIEMFTKEIIAKLTELEKELICISEEFDEDKYEMTLKHFDSFVRKNTDIKAYKQPECFKIWIVLVGDNQRADVCALVNIVKRQLVISTNVFIGTDSVNERIEDIKMKLAQYSVDINRDGNFVTIKGFEDDVRESMSQMRHMLRNGKECLKSFRIERCQCLLMQKQTVENYINETLNSEANEPVWWKVFNDKLYVEGQDDEAVQRIAAATVDVVKCLSFDPINEKVVQTKLWIHFKKEIAKTFSDKIAIDYTKLPKIQIAVTAEISSEVEKRLKEFKKCFSSETIQHTYKTDFLWTHLKADLEKTHFEQCFEIDLNENNVIVSGTVECVNDVCNIIWDISSHMYGIPNKLIAEIIKGIEVEGETHHYGVALIKKKTNIVIKKGRIEEEQADVVVNSASSDLDISNGNVSSITYSINKAAGADVQRWLDNHNIKRPVANGTVIDSIAGTLKCTRLFHAILPEFDKSREAECKQTMKSIVGSCLTMANSNRFGSIAFPAIGTGVLHYPHEFVAEHVIQMVVHFVNMDENMALEEVKIVLLPEDERSWEAFEKVTNRRKSKAAKAVKDTTTALDEHPTWPCENYCRVVVPSRDKHDEALYNINERVQRSLDESAGNVGGPNIE